MNHRTPLEQAYLVALEQRIARLKEFLNQTSPPLPTSTGQDWHRYLAEMKALTGNTSNDASFVACLLAKEHLERTLSMAPFDVALKPQGAPGLDIDAQTRTGERVVGEVKTTTPYLPHDLGAQQKAAFYKDFAKLWAARAKHKYLFVTDSLIFDLLRGKYSHHLPAVTVVLLTTGAEHRPHINGS